MAELPPPPVPSDADLTDFKFMPLEVARLRRSKAWLICKRRPELAFYMLNLWTAAWHERPAGSLEDDDDVLADAAMCSPDKWPKVRADVMRGWVKAADGRLYHPVVAEKVMDSWHGKVVARWRKECDRVRKENHKRKEKELPPLEFPPEPPRLSSAVPAESRGIPAEKPLKGEGRDREGIGKGDSLSSGKPTPPTVPPESQRDNHPLPPHIARAQPIPKGWQPSADTRAKLRTSRPDLTDDDIALRDVEFRTWCDANAKTTFNPDATWLGFMVKTHAQPARDSRRQPAGEEDPIAAGISQSLARRHLLAGG